jgi:hypothetical protein
VSRHQITHLINHKKGSVASGLLKNSLCGCSKRVQRRGTYLNRLKDLNGLNCFSEARRFA